MTTTNTIEIIGKHQLNEFLLDCFQGEEYREAIVIDNVKIDLYFTERRLAIFIDQECLTKEDIAKVRNLLKCSSYVIKDIRNHTDLANIINELRSYFYAIY